MAAGRRAAKSERVLAAHGSRGKQAWPLLACNRLSFVTDMGTHND